MHGRPHKKIRHTGGRRTDLVAQQAAMGSTAKLEATLLRDHVRLVHVAPEQRSAALEMAAERVAELCGLYASGGMIQVFRELNRAVEDEQVALGRAAHMRDFVAPLLSEAGAGAARAVAECLELEARAHRDRGAAIRASAQVAAAQLRIKELLEPLFLRDVIREQKRRIDADPSLRELSGARAHLSDREPRVEITSDAQGVRPTVRLNEFFGIKHLHRPCRTAAGAPFDTPDVHWKALAVTATCDTAAELLGGHSVLCVELRPPTEEAVHLGVVGGAEGGFAAPVVQKVALLPWMVRTVPVDDPATSRGLPRGAVLDVSMRGMGGHAKTIAMRLIAPTHDWVPLLLRAREPPAHADYLGTGGDEAHVPTEDLALDELTEREALGAVADAGCDVLRGLRETQAEPAPVWHSGWCIWGVCVHRDRVYGVMARAEALGAEADLAAMWVRGRPALGVVTARVLRHGETRSKTNTAAWFDRGRSTWEQLLRHHGVEPGDHVATMRAAERLGRAVRCIAEPLRYYVARTAQGLYGREIVDGVREVQAPPSALTRKQQEDLVCAHVWSTQHPCPEVRAGRRLMCDFYREQVGRCVVLTEPEPFARTAPVRRKRKARGLRMYQRERTTSARTLNCDFPAAAHQGS